MFLKKNQNAPRPSEHPPVRGELRFHLYAFFEAAALPSIALRYAGAPIATRVPCRFFRVFFVPLPLSLCCMESTSTFFPSDWCFSTL